MRGSWPHGESSTGNRLKRKSDGNGCQHFRSSQEIGSQDYTFHGASKTTMGTVPKNYSKQVILSFF